MAKIGPSPSSISGLSYNPKHPPFYLDLFFRSYGRVTLHRSAVACSSSTVLSMVPTVVSSSRIPARQFRANRGETGQSGSSMGLIIPVVRGSVNLMSRYNVIETPFVFTKHVPDDATFRQFYFNNYIRGGALLIPLRRRPLRNSCYWESSTFWVTEPNQA
jgi:hypothetical protein